ncbi:MAG: glycosyltransferase [Methanobrevibacter sp.]|jgi:GT2 family glycosyltransferase|nr:glycosyltransferase [Candidatus Methanovirga aequatorialis]
MIEKKIEIVIITYNRHRYLKNTLSQLLKSPFLKCKLTILDNCSNDDTENVCNHFIQY